MRQTLGKKKKEIVVINASNGENPITKVLPEDFTSVLEFLRTCCCQLRVTSALAQGAKHSLV